MSQKAPWDRLWLDVRLATMAGEGYGAVEAGALALEGDRIAYAGPAAGLPGTPASLARIVERLDGRWATPGLIDCHTHLVYGGNRAREFELRLEGATYEEIARAGGGIRSSVAATRKASEGELLKSAGRRLAELVAEGVTTIEIKSGYGLSREAEMKQLRVARKLGEKAGITVATSFLGAHAVPPEFDGQPSRYMDEVIADMLPAIAAEGLADAVDAFCETIGFSPADTERLFQAARRLGLPVKLHAEQLSDQGGAALAAKYGALSADHLEHLSESGIAAMKAAGTVAVLLPGAYYFLRETKLPPIETLRRAGVPIAISTDHNPGTSPALSLLLMMNMAATLFRMTPAEALAGVTTNAARALGLADRGVLAPGKRADIVFWDIENPAELTYAIGANPRHATVVGGELRS